jgi:DNA polymerase II small subunit/DNA polymerase delta subunit B
MELEKHAVAAASRDESVQATLLDARTGFTGMQEERALRTQGADHLAQAQRAQAELDQEVSRVRNDIAASETALMVECRDKKVEVDQLHSSQQSIQSEYRTMINTLRSAGESVSQALAEAEEAHQKQTLQQSELRAERDSLATMMSDVETADNKVSAMHNSTA